MDHREGVEIGLGRVGLLEELRIVPAGQGVAPGHVLGLPAPMRESRVGATLKLETRSALTRPPRTFLPLTKKGTCV